MGTRILRIAAGIIKIPGCEKLPGLTRALKFFNKTGNRKGGKKLTEQKQIPEKPKPVTEDRFFELLTEVCDELPDGMYDELHHGIIMSPSLKISPYAQGDDLVIMGEYMRSQYGNRIVIYYGSFRKAYGYLSEDELKQKIREVVRHEFRHHMENLAGMHGCGSLEREDEEQLKKYFRAKQY